MENRYMKVQCQNMLSAVAAFTAACDLAVLEDDDRLSPAEVRDVRKLHSAAARFCRKLQAIMER